MIVKYKKYYFYEDKTLKKYFVIRPISLSFLMYSFLFIDFQTEPPFMYGGTTNVI